MANLLDQLAPDTLTQDAAGRLMGFCKADEGIGVEEEKQALQQLGAPPHLLLSLTQHVSTKKEIVMSLHMYAIMISQTNLLEYKVGIQDFF